MTRPVTHPPAPPTGIDEAIQRIRANGGRVTAGKRALIELIHSDEAPLTADEIAARLSDHDRSAIYRSLAQLEELGIAEHLHLGHGQAVYRPTGQATVPVLCNVCGTTADLARAETQAFVEVVARRTGITLDLTHLPLAGTCRRCH